MAYHLSCHNCDLEALLSLEAGLAAFGVHQDEYPEHHPELVKDVPE
ncbi:MAG: hypothetical protein ABEI39_04520 [Halobacteriales archaeon]